MEKQFSKKEVAIMMCSFADTILTSPDNYSAMDRGERVEMAKECIDLYENELLPIISLFARLTQ